eukprot:scaffold774_cov248-Pinguiococcus_pyrenoidosus.AAC.15
MEIEIEIEEMSHRSPFGLDAAEARPTMFRAPCVGHRHRYLLTRGVLRWRTHSSRLSVGEALQPSLMRRRRSPAEAGGARPPCSIRACFPALSECLAAGRRCIAPASTYAWLLRCFGTLGSHWRLSPLRSIASWLC